MHKDSLFNLNQKVVLLTGANGQLGGAIAAALAEFGAYIVLADKAIDRCRRRQEGIHKSGVKIMSLELDVTDKDSIEKCVDKALRRFHKIDILINNAGMGVFTPFETRESDEFDRVMAVNAKGPFLCSQVVARDMVKRKNGNIINIGSIYGFVAPDQRIYADSGRNCSEIYAMSKAAVIQFTKYLACYLNKYNIRVNCISPGGIYNNQSREFVKNYSYKTPLGRMARQEEIQGAVIYLASDASKYVTGHNLVVDGGFTCW